MVTSVSSSPLPDVIHDTSTRTSTQRFMFVFCWIGSIAALVVSISVPMGYRWLPRFGEDWATELQKAGVAPIVHAITTTALFAAVALAGAGLLAFVRRPKALVWLRHLLVPGYVLVSLNLYAAVHLTNVIRNSGLALTAGDVTIDDPVAICLRIPANWVALASTLVLALVLLTTQWLCRRRSVAALYARAGAITVDPQDFAFHNNLDLSVVLHALLIMVLPALLQVHGCQSREVLLPGGGGGGGGGGGQPEVVKVVKKVSKRRKHLSRPNSVITFYAPSMDDSQNAKAIELTTENQFEANRNDADAGNGSGGAGNGFGSGGGKGGGWPGGDSNAAIRFIRLQYNGDKWNDGLYDADHSREDENFLDELHKASHLRMAERGEAVTASQLRSFKKGAQPPFLYMTGEAGIDISDSETKVIRQYLLDGGLLFADCGSPQWHNAFGAWSHRLFPDQPLLDISNDDPIFHSYFHFNNGAPPLWHHGGERALGIKQDGRWVVFYFPGDMNDAWKTGHNDATPAAVRQSYEMGINVVKYAIDHYWGMNRGKSKG